MNQGVLEMLFQFNPKLIFVSCDSGKSASKYSWLNTNHQIESDVFPTLSREVTSSESTFTDSNLLTIDKKSFLVGGTGDYNLDNDHSKLGPTHELCVITSIAKVLVEKLNLPYNENEPYDVVLSVNVPLEDFKQTEKEKYLELYEQGKEFDVKLGDNRISFRLKAVELFFESQGAILRNQQLKGKPVLVYDIGGKNDTYILYNEDGRPVAGQNDMAYNGLLLMLQHIADDLRRKHKTTFTLQSVEKMVLGTGNKADGFDESFDRHATEWVKRFKTEVMKLQQVNTQLTHIIFSGGGSLALQKYLQKEFSEYKNVYFSNDGKYDNAHGGLIRALNIHGK